MGRNASVLIISQSIEEYFSIDNIRDNYLKAVMLLKTNVPKYHKGRDVTKAFGAVQFLCCLGSRLLFQLSKGSVTQ